MEDRLFTLSADAAPVLAALTSIDEALAGLEERVVGFGTALDSLDAGTASLGAVTDATLAADEAATALAGALDAEATTAASASEASEALAAAITGLTGAVEANTAALTASAAANEEDAVAKDTNTAATSAQTGQLHMLALALVAVVAAFAYLGVSAQNSLSIVASLTGATTQEMQGYTEGAITLSNQLGSTLKATGDGLYYVVSAGFKNADAMKVLQPAMMDAASGGAQLSDVANGLTSALNAYSASADDATHYSDIMIKAVTDGKQTFGDFASAIGVAAVTGRTTGISFDQVAAAEATMTQSGLTARRAVVDLDFMMRSIGLSIDKVADTAGSLGLSFDKTKYASLDLIGKLEYLKEISNGNMAAFEKLVGGAPGLTAAQILLANSGKAYTQVLNDMKNSSGATAAAFKIHEQTISAHANHAAAALSILAYRITELATPAVSAVFDTLTHLFQAFGDFVDKHAAVAIPILGALAAVIGGVLVASLGALLGPMLAAVGAAMPVILIVAGIAAAIGLLVMWFKQAWSQSEQFRNAVKMLGDILGYAWQQLQAAFNDPALKDALKQLGEALKPLLPVLGVIAFVLAMLIVGAIYLVVASLRGLLGALPGIITMFEGIGNYLAGFVRLVVDVFTNWNDIPAAVNQMAAGVLQIFGGFFEAIFGAFRGFANTFGNAWDNAFNGPLKPVKDFVDQVVKFFQWLYDTLVGHSIVPDMFRDMLLHFTKFPGDALKAIQDLNTKMARFFIDQANQAFGWGRDMIQGMLNGMLSLLNSGAVDGAALSIAQTLAKYLHFTHPDEGPLSDAEEWMPHFGDTLSRGMEEQQSRLSRSASTMAEAIARGARQSSEQAAAHVQGAAASAATHAAAASAGSSGDLAGSSTVIDLLQQMVNLEQQMVDLLGKSAAAGSGVGGSGSGGGYGGVATGGSGNSAYTTGSSSHQVSTADHGSKRSEAEARRAIEEYINRNNEEKMNRARRSSGGKRTYAW